MKKLVGYLAAAGIFLGFAFPAFAQTQVSPCANGGIGSFQGLCNLTSANIGQIISTGVIILLVIAVVISLFFLIWGGIRWITSGGDKAKVAEARSHIIAAIVGLVIAFLAFFILTVILSIFKLSLTNIQLPTLPD